MKWFLHLMGIASSMGIYLIVFMLMYAFTQKDALEIMIVDLIFVYPFFFFIEGNVEKLIRIIENVEKRSR